MRVYEFAKEKDLSSREVLDLLSAGGFELASHMSVLSDDALVYLKNKFTKTVKKDVKEPVIAKEAVKKVEKTEKVTQSNEKVLVDNKIVAQKQVQKEEKKVDKGVVVQAVSEKQAVVQPVIEQKKAVTNTIVFNKKNNAERVPVTQISIKQNMPLFEAASLMGKTDGELIFSLLRGGMVCNRNHMLPVDTIKTLAESFGISVLIEKMQEASEQMLAKNISGQKRWPIVVVMGHVDHGKTTLLDYLRKQNTAAKEKGGITQHLGAYEVNSKHGKIVFLDTPGHEAFTSIRSRGTSITDIAILVISAEDGIKPQTVEAIKIAKKAGVPIIVAVNKIDKVPAERLDPVLQTIKRELAEKDLLVEDWGGDIICVPISAKTGAGVDELLEMVVLQSDLMDLKAELDVPAKAFILESKIEKGFGPVATVIVHEGVLRVGDYFTCGASCGKIKLLINSFGQRVTQANPSTPIKIVGFEIASEIGGWLTVVSLKDYKNAKNSNIDTHAAPISIMDMSLIISEKDKKSINIILKTDARGSKEAVEGSITKLSKLTEKDCSKINIISSGIGDVSESDVISAQAVNAMILVLHSKVDKKAAALAQEKNIKIKTFDVIYHMVEYLEEELKKTKKIQTRWVPKAKLLVKKVFDIKGLGIIAGCSVQEGVVANGNKVVCMRGNRTIGEGIIKSLQKDRKVVKEVHAGFECGFVSNNFQDWQEDDIVNVFAEEKILSE